MENGKTCGLGCGFNYCFWAKLIVAIPALPIAGLLAASAFESAAAQVVAAGVTVFVLVWLAIWVDRIPALQKKVVKIKCG